MQQGNLQQPTFVAEVVVLQFIEYVAEYVLQFEHGVFA